MAIAFTSITPTAQNQNGKYKELYCTLVISGTYSAGGTVLSAAEKAKFGADGKVIWVDNDPANILNVKYNSSTGAIQLFVLSTGVEAGAISGAGTYLCRVMTIGSGASGAAFL